jgi:hypothetical protein
VQYAPAAHKKKPANKLAVFLIIVIVIAAVGAAVWYFFGDSLIKSDEDKITERIGMFAAAIDNGDLDKAIDCLDSRTRNALKAANWLGSNVIGFNVSDLLAGMIGIGSAFIPQDASFAVTVHDIEVTGDTAIAYVTYNVGGMQTGGTLNMTKSGLNWYIDVWRSIMGLIF